MPEDVFLFSDFELTSAREAQRSKMLAGIDDYDGSRLLNTSADDLASYFAQTYQIVPIQIRENEVAVDQREIRIDVSQDGSRYISDRTKPFYLTGTKLTLYVPFDGEPDLFKARPSHLSLAKNRGNSHDGHWETAVS